MDYIDEWMKRLVGGPAEAPKEKPQNSNSNSQTQNQSHQPRTQSQAGGQSQQGKRNDKKRDFPKNERGQQNNSGRHQNRRNDRRDQKSDQRGGQRQKQRSSPVRAKLLEPGQRRQLPTAKPTKVPPVLREKLKIIPLGGLNEVGKNMMAIEYEDDIIIIDMGFEFPSEDLYGIDYVIPDVSYLEENKHRIRGVLLTHGHLDHIGGIPYILPKLDFPPVFGATLTMGLVEHRVKEFKQEKMAKLYAINPDKPLKLGQIVCKFFRVAHSIPDALGIILETPIGVVVHTGDFKFDESPARNIAKADVHKMEELGRQNVLALLCESTNSREPGHTISEKEVGEALDQTIGKTKDRIIIGAFSSQIGRLQQIIDAAIKHNRKIYVGGRSMQNNIDISARLNYLQIPKDLIMDLKKYKEKSTPDHETLIITTGSQGEDFSALSRIARNEHPQIKIKKGDTIVFSSSPIPGNENAINSIINRLCILGAKIIHNKMADIHTSGHAKQEELKRMINLIKPKYLVPVHGEYYMRQALGFLATEHCGIPEERVMLLQNGDILLAGKDSVSIAKEGIDTKYILIDGRGEGQMGSQVIIDREIMSQNGALVIMIFVNKKSKQVRGNPEVISRGFVYMHETDEIVAEISNLAREAYKKIAAKNPGASYKDMKKYIRQSIDKYTNEQLERRPLIIPLIVEC